MWSLAPSFAFPGERRAQAIFANAVDARSGRARWYLGGRGGAPRRRARAGQPTWCWPTGRPLFATGGRWSGAAASAGWPWSPGWPCWRARSSPSAPTRPTPPWRPTSWRPCSTPAARPASSRRPGSGKTRVLTERARHLLRRWRLPGRAITLVAYNKRAADEMKERTPDLPDLQVRTLNALGLSLLTRSGPGDHHRREPRCARSSTPWSTCRAGPTPTRPWPGSRPCRPCGWDCRPRPRWRRSSAGDVDGLPEVFDRYRRAPGGAPPGRFRRAGLQGDRTSAHRPGRPPLGPRLLPGPAGGRVPGPHPGPSAAHTPAGRPEGAVFGVGDDDQTIYGYSGASPEWLIDFRRFFPTAGRTPAPCQLPLPGQRRRSGP